MAASPNRLAAPPWRPRLEIAPLAIAIALATALHVAYYFPRVVDDLFISLRYAENAAHGHGVVYNLGERVEGYSSPLWLFLQSLGFVLHAEPVTWTKLLGLLSLAALQVGLYAFGREVLGLRPVVALLPCVYTAGNSYVVDWAVLGLETPANLALLVWAPVLLRRAARRPSRRRFALAALGAIALATVRPEAPMFLVLVVLGEILATRVWDLGPRLRRIAVLGAVVGAVLVALLVARRAYFGLWLPHTFYVKGSDVVFDLARLAPLTERGVAVPEELLYVGGVALAVALALFRREATTLLVCAGAMYFTAKVEEDWMPSLRHLLPLTVFVPLAWAWAVDGLWSAARLAPVFRARFRALAVACAAVVTWAGYAVAQVDVRLSPSDKHGEAWAVPKHKDKWRDTLLALSRKEPPHVAAMGPFDMGMITQNYRLYEACAAKLDGSWYVGRDIGKVGFYSEAKIFDTAGLFTPALTASPDWREHRVVDDALLQNAMARRPVAAELYEGWTPALARRRDLQRGYDVVVGSPAWPLDIVLRDCPKPSPEEVLARYRWAVAKFPQWFYLETLYGESVGAAIRKRLRIVEANAATAIAARAASRDPTAGAKAGAKAGAQHGGVVPIFGGAR